MNGLVIDAHTHLSSHSPTGKKLSANSLIETMDAAGIDKSISVGMGGNPLKKLKQNNDFNFQAALDYPERIIPFIYFEPRYKEDGLAEIDRCMEKGKDIYKGIKVGHNFALAKYMYPMMEKAQKYGLVFCIHCDATIRGHPLIVAELANSFPKVDIMLLHMVGRTGAATETLAIKAAENNPNIWLETSYSWPFPIKKAIDQIGVERILFGSDGANKGGRWWPGQHFEREEYHTLIMMENIRCLNLPIEDEKKILGLNTAKLLDLEV
jgi:predicted TIM-barrel fold metal-dependent hydrolase